MANEVRVREKSDISRGIVAVRIPGELSSLKQPIGNIGRNDRHCIRSISTQARREAEREAHLRPLHRH